MSSLIGSYVSCLWIRHSIRDLLVCRKGKPTPRLSFYSCEKNHCLFQNENGPVVHLLPSGQLVSLRNSSHWVAVLVAPHWCVLLEGWSFKADDHLIALHKWKSCFLTHIKPLSLTLWSCQLFAYHASECQLVKLFCVGPRPCGCFLIGIKIQYKNLHTLFPLSYVCLHVSFPHLLISDICIFALPDPWPSPIGQSPYMFWL